MDVFYARFMDDWVIIAKTRWKLKNAIRTVNETLNHLKLETHSDKTFIGRVERGFNFLGDHLTLEKITPSKITIEKFGCGNKAGNLFWHYLG
nr:reverse transcriptase domain-containing protein [uncultured Desulfobacter sp.]